MTRRKTRGAIVALLFYQCTEKKKKDNLVYSTSPKKWGVEHNNPRYILDLLCGIVTVSMRTLELVAEIPKVDF